MKIGVIFAMESELDAFVKHFDDVKTMISHPYEVYKIAHSTHEIYAIQSGIGKVNAAMITTWFLHTYPCDALINTGIAGGVNVTLLETVVASYMVYHDVDVTAFNYARGQIPLMPERFSSDPTLLKAYQNAFNNDEYKQGVIASGDQFMTKLHSLHPFMDRYKDLYAVDMESAAIAHIAYRYNTPFLSFRVISDVLESPTQISDETSPLNATLKSGATLKRLIDAL